MSNKLVKGRRPFFNADPKADAKRERTVVTLPFPREALRDLIIVVRKQDGSIDVAGPINEPERCLTMLKEGMARVIQWNERPNPTIIQPAQHIPPGLRDLST